MMEVLSRLEQLLNEFYSPMTTNEQKRAIERQLNEFSERVDCWKQCCFILQNTTNPFVCMYCLTTIETLILDRNAQLSVSDRQYLRTLFQNVMLRDGTASFIRNKFIKLIVDIARLDWPHDYPEFFTAVLNLTSNLETKEIGLIFLCTTVDEFICPREDIPSIRQDELKRLFLLHIPQVFSLLASSLHSFCSTNVIVPTNLINSTLLAVKHLFSWVPLSDYYTSDFVTSIYPFLYTNEDSSVTALGVLNEILYQKCVPQNKVHLIIDICKQINLFVSKLLQGDFVKFDNDSCFISTLLDSIRLILITHWHRIENNGESKIIIELMSSFHQMTFSVLPLARYYEALHIWCEFIEYLKMRNLDHIKLYESLLISLMSSVIKKAQLEEQLYKKQFVNNCIHEVEEYNNFLDQNTKLLEKIVQILPNNICCNIVDMWKNSGQFYSQLISTQTLPDTIPVEFFVSLHTFTVNTHILINLHNYLPSDLANASLTDLLKITIAANKYSVHKCGNITEIMLALILVHCELLLGLRSWLPDAKVEKEILIELLATSYPLITEAGCDVNYKLLDTVANFIFYLIGTFNESHILNPLLVNNGCFTNLPPQIRLTIHCAIFNWLLNNSMDPEEHRITILSNLFTSVFPNSDENIKSATILIQHSTPKNTACKKLLAKVVQPGLEHIIKQFPKEFEMNRIKCKNIMEFVLECFYVLQEHIAEFLREALTIFVACFSRPCVQHNAEGSDILFQILITAIEFPTAVFLNLIPSSVSLCLEYLRILNFQNNSDIQFSIFQLLSAILLHKWRLIFEKQFLYANSGLNEIMKAYLDCFEKSDVNIIASNIRNLELINDRWKLYHKDFFRQKYLADFRKVLLLMLIKKAHNILTESIINGLYNMASVNFNEFYTVFIVSFVSQLPNIELQVRNILLNNLKHDTDLPSFEINILKFVNDVRCYNRMYRSEISSTSQK